MEHPSTVARERGLNNFTKKNVLSKAEVKFLPKLKVLDKMPGGSNRPGANKVSSWAIALLSAPMPLSYQYFWTVYLQHC